MYDRILELDAKGKITTAYPLAPKASHRKFLDWLHILVNDMPEMVPFEITNVADFLDNKASEYLKSSGKNLDAGELFKGELMRLPCECCWFEFAVQYERGPTRVGVVAMNAPDSNGFLLTPMYLDSADGGISFSLHGGDIKVAATLDEDGLYQACFFSSELSEVAISHPSLYSAVISWTAYVLHAIYLLHWKKDVHVVAISPSRQQRRQSERDKQKPPVEYKTINIASWIKKYQTITEAENGGFLQRWHLVRGHKATWTESAPQFGCEKCKKTGSGHGQHHTKPHVGTFWIDPHHVGRKELGEIRHVYAVKAPK